ncbi:MAG: amidohydrolase, partial [Balneolaceae bacterium]
MKLLLQTFLLCLLTTASLFAQMPDAPDRTEGEGPFDRMIIRGVTMIDGTGSPSVGPVDIVIEGNRITQIATVGYPGVPINENRRPEARADDHVVDAEGMYVLPGFFDMHAHTGGNAQGTVPEYVYKLWLAHGITS